MLHSLVLAGLAGHRPQRSSLVLRFQAHAATHDSNMCAWLQASACSKHSAVQAIFPTLGFSFCFDCFFKVGLAVASEFQRQMSGPVTQANLKNSSDMDKPNEGCRQPPAGSLVAVSAGCVGIRGMGAALRRQGTSGAHCGVASGARFLSGCLPHLLVSSQLRCKCDVK